MSHLNGPEFLQLYLILFCIAVVAGFVIPDWLRPPGREHRIDDADEAAFMAGGHLRLAETVTVRMMQTGALRIGAANALLPGALTATSSRLEAAIYHQLPSDWNGIGRIAKREAEPIIRRLTSTRMMMDASTSASLRRWQTAPYAALFLFGSLRLISGISRGKPVGYLALLLILTAICALTRYAIHDHRTKGGKRTIADMQHLETRLKRAPTEPEMDRAVALYGTGVLIASTYAGLHTIRSSGDGGMSSSSGGSTGGCSSGDSGCGGGGCGGCGG